MILLFRNYFDLPLNVLFWLMLSTFAQPIFFAIYCGLNPSTVIFKRKLSNE
jgi:hypothetical protein